MLSGAVRQWRERLRPRPKLRHVNPETHVLLLDVDGVLIQPPEFYGQKLRRKHPTIFGQFMQTAFQSASTGKSDLMDHLPELLNELGRTDSPQDFYLEWMEYENVAHEPTLQAVQRLRGQGWRVYLATNQEKHRTRHLLEEGGLSSVTDGHFASYAVGHRKPSREYYEAVTGSLGIAPEQIIFWDDSAENVEAARGAGWTAYLFTTAADFRRVMGL